MIRNVHEFTDAEGDPKYERTLYDRFVVSVSSGRAWELLAYLLECVRSGDERVPLTFYEDVATREDGPP